MENKIQTIIELEKEIKELDDATTGECDDVVANKMERKIGKLKDKQQELIDALSDSDLDILNKELNKKDDKQFVVKIYKKDTGIDNGIINENGQYTKLFYAKDETEAQKIKVDGLLINKENEYKIEINKVEGCK